MAEEDRIIDMLTLASTKVLCEKESQDGYEASNLQGAAGSASRARGFLAAYFLKPPVELTIAFAAPVPLHCVKLRPAVSRQRPRVLRVAYAASADDKYWTSLGPPIVLADDVAEVVLYNSRSYVGKPIRAPSSVLHTPPTPTRDYALHPITPMLPGSNAL